MATALRDSVFAETLKFLVCAYFVASHPQKKSIFAALAPNVTGIAAVVVWSSPHRERFRGSVSIQTQQKRKNDVGKYIP